MGFSKKSNCVSCGHPLHLQDLKESHWEGDVQEFCFICSTCSQENVIKFALFNKNGHVRPSYISALKNDKEFLTSDLLTKIEKHVSICEECKKALDEEFVSEIEEKIKFNEKTLLYFVRHSKDIYQKIENFKANDSVVEWFEFEGKKFEINEDDEFFRDSREKGKNLQICYYLRTNSCLSGMACLSYDNHSKELILEKLWVKDKRDLEKEQDFFKALKSGKVKIKLETITKIFHALKNI